MRSRKTGARELACAAALAMLLVACGHDARVVPHTSTAASLPLPPDAGGQVGSLGPDEGPPPVTIRCATLQRTGRADSVVSDIDASGTIAAGYVRDRPAYHSFRWVLGEPISELPNRVGEPLPRTDAQAAGISGDGGVIVGAWTRPGGITAYRFTNVYEPLRSFSDAPATASSTALDANGDASVIVGSANDGDGDRPVRWSGDGINAEHLTSEPDGGSRSEGQATAVSADGRVIVGASAGVAFRWSDESGLQSLDAVGDPVNASGALDVSADGRVVVGSRGGKAVRWVFEQPGPTELTPAGAVSVANAVSGDGQVIVGFRSLGDEDRAFVWTEDGANRAYPSGLHDLQSLLPADVVAGWQLSEARGISADGRVIVGVGVTSRDDGGPGVVEGWAVTLPETCP